MSVQAGPTFKRYAANGVATVYAIPFLLLDAADLQITLDGVSVTTGFTLSGINNPTSSCTFTVAPTGDLLFLMVVPFQRLADYQINGDFLAPTVNRDYDRLWLAIKQLSRDNTRGLTVSLLEPEGIPPLPAKAARALKMLAFDANGDPVTSNLTLAQLEQQPALALEAAAQAAASALSASNSKDAAALSATASSSSATLSAQWAENPEDVPVTPGFFSAHHWATKAAAIAASLSALFSRMTAVELRATNLEYGYVSAQTAYTNGGTVTLSHTLTGRPARVSWEAVCITSQSGYAAGDRLYLGEGYVAESGGTSLGFTSMATATQIIMRVGGLGIWVIPTTGSAANALTPANWRLVAKASLR